MLFLPGLVHMSAIPVPDSELCWWLRRQSTHC